jgi:broad specificity phosphatase PhoE
MRLYFVRHGESEANLLSEFSNRGFRHGLTVRGRAQSAALAQKLEDHRISRLFTSPLMRAVQTTELLAHRLRVPCELTDALREYDCGILEGRSDAESWHVYETVFREWVELGSWERRIEGGESFIEMQERFVPFVEELVEGHRDSSAGFALVGHGGLYRCMLPLVLVDIGFGYVQRHPIGNAEYVVAEPGSQGLTCLEWCGQVDLSPS